MHDFKKSRKLSKILSQEIYEDSFCHKSFNQTLITTVKAPNSNNKQSYLACTISVAYVLVPVKRLQIFVDPMPSYYAIVKSSALPYNSFDGKYFFFVNMYR